MIKSNLPSFIFLQAAIIYYIDLYWITSVYTESLWYIYSQEWST